LRIGQPRLWFADAYHSMLTLRWWVFLLLFACVYLAGNVVFALLYLAQSGSILNAHPGSLADAFFFSVQTMATIGYGAMSPATTYANSVMTAETVFGVTLLALGTGLLFARISRPTARVLFSDVAVVAPYNGVPTLMVRLANMRRNQIVQAEVGLAILRNERTLEGERMRRFYDLRLLRARSPVFAMTFTVMHPLDELSPLHGTTQDQLLRESAELIVTVTGLDETVSQIIHARHSYTADEVRFGHRFVDIIGQVGGRMAIDYRRFHVTEPLASAAPAVAEPQDDMAVES
jgi:inward rectifier potassium channel